MSGGTEVSMSVSPEGRRFPKGLAGSGFAAGAPPRLNHHDRGSRGSDIVGPSSGGRTRPV
eukprot:CAMPEP_0206423874 /NCGR_PEP_ID=MMETSP0324_2-20121206/2912_1 /ASSEMBLY_ACC=CAM_ASM_000836 /TAXON_ID=2866 /ORGANISM="Crypthecodinium cohnii, Strain Seligo" /LENGTH=59 /DNA_ID=CAMNT_0053888461 /DNA_START=483 /DNA_END=662 /DNA_ORIENTATION=-